MPLPTAPRPPSPLPHRPTPPFPGIPWRRQPPVEENEGWWSITFSDLVLLLFAFFVLWHIADKQRAVAVARTTHLAAAEPQETGAPAAAPDLPAPEPLAETAPAPEPAVPPPSAPLLTPAERPAPLQEEASVWREMQAEVTRYVHEQGLDRTVGVISTEQGLVISLNDTITFPPGQVTLSPAVAPVLARVATLAAERAELNLEISGHTDDRPIATTTFPSNWELSAARASRVARALLAQGGIDPVRISTRGYAHYRPLSPNDSEAHRTANRRVEIRFFHQVRPAEDLLAAAAREEAPAPAPQADS